MPQLHGKNTLLEMFDSTGASATISGDLNQFTLSWSRSNPDVTTFGQNTTQRIAGIADYDLSGTAIYNSNTASAVQVTMAGWIAASTNTLFKWYPASKTSGCEFWTGCVLLSAYSEQAPVNGAVTLSFTLQSGAGSLTASTA